MTQFSTQTDSFLNTNRNIYEVVYLANNANGDIISLTNPLPVTLGSENITITGNVNFVDTVNVASSPENPVHTHITEVGTSGLLDVSYMPIGGNVNVNNIITITGNVTANGTVNIGNLPSVQTVNGTINIANTVQVNVTNWPATQNVSIANTVIVTGNVTTNGTVNIGNLPATQTVNGTINIGNTVIVTGNVTTNGTVIIQDGGNVISIDDANGSITVDGNVNATIIGTPTVTFGGANLDAFGRLRVSNPFTLFDGAQRYRDDPFKWDQVDTGAATSTFVTNESSVLMSVSGNGDESLRQTKSVFAYQPGKSLLTMATFAMTTPTAGLRQRVGLFGTQNGVYFEVDGTTVNLVIRKYTSGSVDDTTEKFAQATWNGDKLNGTGPSGITLVVSRSQIFWCDIEWLGVGSVRCGFVIDGQFIVCHTFHHANQVGFNKVYMTTATLPVRYELTSTGSAGTMRAICSTVMSEGGYMNRSVTRSIGTSLTGKNLSQTVYRPLVCIRLKAANLESVVVPVKFDVFGLQQAAFAYRLIINPTLTDASWTSSGSDSSVEYDIAATALSGGTVVDQGIFVGSNKGGSASITSNDVDFSQQIGRTIAGVSDIWCLAAIATTTNDDAVGVVTWQEHI